MLIVRRERAADALAARRVQAAAFDPGDGTEAVEARLLDELRADDGWLPQYSHVAEIDGEVVGHVVCTRGYVDDLPALGLGPIGVTPGLQRVGIGSALVRSVLGAADAGDEPLVALLGSPAYYSQFGFVASSALGIEPPEAAWGAHFQVRTLDAYAGQRGRFRYAAPFDRL